MSAIAKHPSARGKKKKSFLEKNTLFDHINHILLILFSILMLVPFYHCIVLAFSDGSDLTWNGISFFWPRVFSLDSFKKVFDDSEFFLAARNSILRTVLGAAVSSLVTSGFAFALSHNELKFRRVFTFMGLVCMYFSGGMIPTYLQIKSLNLLNTPIVLILVGGISIYNTIITRSFFQSSIPEEIYESARIDGANDFRCFFSIALPLAKPIIAVIALYYGVAHWNSYFNALLYVSKTDYQPLQLVLRSILLLNEGAMANLDIENADLDMILEMNRRAYVAQTMKYALIFIASAPLLAVYPFVQKYFVKGVMIGSVKG